MSLPRSNSTPKGFTLIEAMIVVAIIGVLSSLAGAAMVYGMTRVRLKNALFEIGAISAAAQIRASSSGVPNYVVFYQDASVFGVAHLQKQDPEPTSAEWSALDLDNLPSGWREVDRLVLSEANSLTFAPLSRFTAATVKAPFPTPSLTASGSTTLQAACNFCVAATSGARGILRFSADGTMRTSPVNSALALTSALVGLEPVGTGATVNSKLFAFAIPAGMVRIFDK